MEPSSAFHCFTRLSVLPENTVLPSDETAIHVTDESCASIFAVCFPEESQIRSVLSADPDTTPGSGSACAAGEPIANAGRINRANINARFLQTTGIITDSHRNRPITRRRYVQSL